MIGTTIQLVVKTQTSTDAFGAPVYEEELVDVEDVLVGQPSTNEITDAIQMYGKKIDYTLGIPKGDEHDWTNTQVYIWGELYDTIGYPMTGEEANIPLRWGSNVKVTKHG